MKRRKFLDEFSKFLNYLSGFGIVKQFVSFRSWVIFSLKNFIIVISTVTFLVYALMIAFYWYVSGVSFDNVFWLITLFTFFDLVWAIFLFWFIRIRKSCSIINTRFIRSLIDFERVNHNKNSWGEFERMVSEKYNLQSNFKIRKFLDLSSFITLFLGITLKITTFHFFCILSFFFASIFMFAKLVNSLIIEYHLITEPIPANFNFILPKPLERLAVFMMRKAFTTLTPEAIQQGAQIASKFYMKNFQLINSSAKLLASTGLLLLGADEARALFVGETTFISRAGEISRTGCYSRHNETALMASSLSNEGVDVKEFCYPDSKELNPRLVKKRFLSEVDDINIETWSK